MPTTKKQPGGAQVARGAMLMVALKMAERSIGFVSTLILARLLTPADFGLVAMAMSVVALMELMGAFGFETAIIQRQDAERKHFDTAWTFGVIFSSVTALLLLALAIPAAHFYREPRVMLILPVLAAGALAQGFENIGTVAFRKELDFGREFRFLLSKKVISFTITIGLAFAFRSFWALVIGTVVSKWFSVWISYRVHPFRPKFSLAATRDLFHFSRWLFLSNLVLFLQNKSDAFILGRTVGASDLGLYNIASEIATMPSTELIAPINRAVFPAYAMLSADLPRLREKFLEVFRFIAVLSLPVCVGLVCVSDLAVQVLLGDNWVAAVPLLQLFTVCGLTSSLQSNLILVIVAMGKPKANTMLSAAMLVVYLPALFWAGVRYGTLGAAWVHLIMAVIALIPLHIVFFRLTELRPAAYFATLWRPALAAAGMAAVVLTMELNLNSTLHGIPLLALACYMIAGTLSYGFFLLILWHLNGRPAKSAETAILLEVTRKLARAVRSSS
ncbi:MAG: lipopolysaccharide biosynthesis protein [Pseudomonadota bacterium]